MAKQTVNKSEFVRSFPADVSAGDIVKAAKAKGIALNSGYVYTVRMAAKKRGGAAAVPAAVAVVAETGARVAAGVAVSLDAAVRKIVADEVTKQLRERFSR